MRRAKEGEGLEDFHHVMRGTVDVTGKLQITSGSILAFFPRRVPVLQERAADGVCSPRGPFLELSMNVSHVSEWLRERICSGPKDGPYRATMKFSEVQRMLLDGLGDTITPRDVKESLGHCLSRLFVPL